MTSALRALGRFRFTPGWLDGSASYSTNNGIEANVAGILSEIWAYMRARKKWWLGPILLVLLLVGALLIFAQGSVLAPFIYTIF